MDYRAIQLDLNYDELMNLAGTNDENIKELESLYKLPILIREEKISILTDDDIVFSHFKSQMDTLCKMLKNRQLITKEVIRHSYEAVIADDKKLYDELHLKVITTDFSNKPIKAKTVGQMNLIRAIENNTITISNGPAGSGKTFLAVVMAVKALKEDKYKKIVLTRPVVEAGESLGFLPGDLKEKVDPYLMPLYDALDELLGHERVESLIDRKVIEIIPLAYMRGRSLNNAFIILDEAQNTTSMQMFMFLTRLGRNSKMVITGDLSQIDRIISRNNISGLEEACKFLKNTEDIAIIQMKNADIIRNPLVRKIIDKYEENQD